MTVSVVVAGGVILAGFGFLIPWLRRRQSRIRLESRESLDDETFYRRYYAQSKLSKGLVIDLRNEVAETLKVPAEKLLPQDRFGEQIGAYWITSDDLDVLATKGRIRAEELGLSVDLKKLATVDDYIRCFARSSTANTG